MVWNDAPSHVCRGGDTRGLTFCCPPVKPCPVMNALSEVNLSPQEFMDIKNQFAQETRLGEGKSTCFGSLVWCCKTSKPCPLRDMTFREIGMTSEEYLQLKKDLSDVLHKGAENIEIPKESISALVKSFNITENEAMSILNDCNDDLRMALKVLKVKSLENE